MKNFIFKSVLAVSMTLPLLSHAVTDCGAGTITAIRHSVTPAVGHPDVFDHVVVQWHSDYTPQVSKQWNGGMLIRNPVVANAARVAFHNGTTVRFLSINGNCPNVDQIIQCQDAGYCYNFPTPY